MRDQLGDENVDLPSHEGGQPAGHFRWHLSRAIRRTLSCGYTNVLLVFVPIGIAAGTLRWPVEAVFILNILAIVPLAPLIVFSIDELSPSVGYTFAELMKSIAGNAVEMIVGIIAVSRGQLLVVHSSLLGSILSYALLVLGSSFFIAGYDKKKLTFDKTLTNTMSSMMMAVSICLIVPTIMSVTSPSLEPTDSHTESDIRILSHAVAITLLIIFVVHRYFLLTHASLLNAPNDQGDRHQNHEPVSRADSTHTLGLCATSCILICTTLCITVCAFHLVGSVDGLAKALDINKTFVSLVLIPPAGYSAKCITIIAMARRCQMDSVIRSIITNILQIILFIIPLLVLFGWILEQPFTLDFKVFNATVFFLTLIVITGTIQGGRANYFDGIMLMGTYFLIAVAFYVRPDVLQGFIMPALYGRDVV